MVAACRRPHPIHASPCETRDIRIRDRTVLLSGTVNPFADMAEGSYCADAVAWAVEQDITKGVGDTTFSPS